MFPPFHREPHQARTGEGRVFGGVGCMPHDGIGVLNQRGRRDYARLNPRGRRILAPCNALPNSRSKYLLLLRVIGCSYCQNQVSNDGSLVPLVWSTPDGTLSTLVPHIFMNRKPKTRSPLPRTKMSQPVSLPDSSELVVTGRAHPSRELMICIGWLRLFQTIVSEL